jgi:hypothetical protein
VVFSLYSECCYKIIHHKFYIHISYTGLHGVVHIHTESNKRIYSFSQKPHHTLSWATFCFFRWYLYLYHTRWIFQDFVSGRRHYLPLKGYQCFVKDDTTTVQASFHFQMYCFKFFNPLWNEFQKTPPISKCLHRKMRRLSGRSHSSSPFANELHKSGHLHVASVFVMNTGFSND